MRLFNLRLGFTSRGAFVVGFSFGALVLAAAGTLVFFFGPSGTKSSVTVATGTPQPTPISIAALSRQHLPGMVLAPVEVIQEFGKLQTTGRASYFDENAAANHTINPADSGTSLKEQGFQAGYESVYSEGGQLFGQNLTARVYLWSGPETAGAFIRRHIQDSSQLVGKTIQGQAVLKGFEEVSVPTIGEETAASSLTATLPALQGAEAKAVLVMWRRGPLVAAVGALVFDGSDPTPSLVRLGQRMNERIDGVLQGKIVARPPTSEPPPQPQPVPGANSQTISVDKATLPSMMLGPEDVSDGVGIESEGSPATSDASLAFQRRLTSKDKDKVIRFGSSELTEVRTGIEVYNSPQLARSQVDYLKSLGVEGIRRLVTQSGGASAVGSVSAQDFEILDIPLVGDSSLAMLVKVPLPSGALDAVVLHFVRGPIRAQLFTLSPPGKTTVGDVVTLVRRFDKKIEQSLAQKPPG